MIDTIDLIFGKHLEDLRVQRLRRCQIVSERFLDDHPPPRCARLFGQSSVAELLDDRAEETLGHRQIEQDIGGTVRLSSLGQQLLEMSEGFSLRKIRSYILHAIGEP